MKNTLLIIFTTLLITGCYEREEKSHPFNWATVNARLLEGELLKVAQKQNPYPKEISKSSDQVRKEVRKLSNQIGELTRTARDRCRSLKQEVPEGASAVPKPTRRPDRECLSGIDSDPLISDLKEQKEELGRISRLRSKHESKVREASRLYLETLIRQYSENSFELVLKSERDNVLYNQSGMTVDITDALMNVIRSSEPVITIDQARQIH